MTPTKMFRCSGYQQKKRALVNKTQLKYP